MSGTLSTQATATVVSAWQVTINKDTPLAEVIKKGRFDWVNPEITEDHFPNQADQAGEITTTTIQLLQFDRVVTTEDVEAEIKRLGLHSATIRQLSVLGSQFPDLQHRNPIVAIGEKWRSPDGYASVPYLDDLGSDRGLCLSWFGNQWSPRFLFAVEQGI